MQGQVASPAERESYLLACSHRGRPNFELRWRRPLGSEQACKGRRGKGPACPRVFFFSSTYSQHSGDTTHTWHHTSPSIEQADAQKAKPPSKRGGGEH